MDPELYHYLKYKVTHITSAVLADNVTNMFMSAYDIPWQMEFSTEEDYCDFLDFYELFMLENKIILNDVNLLLDMDPTMWMTDEYAFSKLIYSIRREFLREAYKNDFVVFHYSSKILCYAIKYYQCGLTKAPVMAFIEVYRLSYDYYKGGKL